MTGHTLVPSAPSAIHHRKTYGEWWRKRAYHVRIDDGVPEPWGVSMSIPKSRGSFKYRRFDQECHVIRKGEPQSVISSFCVIKSS